MVNPADSSKQESGAIVSETSAVNESSPLDSATAAAALSDQQSNGGKKFLPAKRKRNAFEGTAKNKEKKGGRIIGLSRTCPHCSRMLSSRNALGLHLEKNVCRNELVKPARAPANRKPTTAATRPPPAEKQKPNQLPAEPPPPAKKSERDPSAKKPKQVDTRKGGDRHRCLCGSTACARLSSKLARLCDREDPWVGMASICCQKDSYRYYLLKEAIVRHLTPNVKIMCNLDTDNIDRMHIAKYHFSRHLMEYRQQAKIHWTTGLTGEEAVKLLHKKEDADSFDDGDGNVKWLQVPDNPLSDVIDHIALLEKAANAKEDRGKLQRKSKKELIQLLIGARQENESLSKELGALRIRKLIDDKIIRDLEGRIKRRMVKPEASVKGKKKTTKPRPLSPASLYHDIANLESQSTSGESELSWE